MQSAQASSGTTSKSKNKPVGSANVVVVKDNKGNGFWLVKEEDEEVAPAHYMSVEPEPLLDGPGDFEVLDAELESLEEFLPWSSPDNWLDKEGEDWDLKDRV